jgi:predicted neutral ceramidase superfamily lipid hydrolase
VWGCDIHVVIIPLILAITFLGLFTYLYLLVDLNLLSPALWLAGSGSQIIVHGQVFSAMWGEIVAPTGLAISMTVNALVTSLIVLKIIKVFWKVKATLGEQRLGVTGGRKLQSIIFILIESGSALFSIQLARLVIAIILAINLMNSVSSALYEPYRFIIAIHQQLNVIIRSIHYYFLFY